MAKKKRRGTTHPGVVLMKPNAVGRTNWRMRYLDPDTGRMTYEKLDPALKAEGRVDAAQRKSRDLAKRRLELEGGAPRATGKELKDALDHYFTAHEKQLRDRTRKIYRTAADKLLAWAKPHRLESADDVTRAKLMMFREALIAEPKRAAVANGKRGKYAATDAKRSPVSVNQELRAVRTVLGYLRDLDFFIRLSHDDLRRALKRLPESTERIEFLKSAQLVKLLEAARQHDTDTYKETRAEHAGEGRKTLGTTARYTPIAPFVAFVLLTGCRYEEALKVEWEQIDLDAGEIHLSGAATKTHKARTVDLEVSPALRAMLAGMRPKDATGPVFGLSRSTADAAAKRLRKDYAAPTFTWQTLRRTCGTYLTNAPGIFGAASAYRSAKQLGHSVAVAEKHYLGLVKGIPADAKTLEDAMGLPVSAT